MNWTKVESKFSSFSIMIFTYITIPLQAISMVVLISVLGHNVKCLNQDTSINASNLTDKIDFVTLTSSSLLPISHKPTLSSQSTSPNNDKALNEKCNKSNSKRCLKFREKEKHAKLKSMNDIWNDADMLQHPIDEEPRRMDRALGEMCLYSADCISGCCMLDRETKIRSCQPKAMRGEKCTTAQIKADLYVDVCPCESGDSNCQYPGEFCSK